MTPGPSRGKHTCFTKLTAPRGLTGEGEFGIVHKAVWHGTTVAVKTLKTSSQLAVGDFRSEVELLQRIHHPNCCQLLGACSKQEPYTLITGVLRRPVLHAPCCMRAHALHHAAEHCMQDAHSAIFFNRARHPPHIETLQPRSMSRSQS